MGDLMFSIILASKSPRRKELLSMMGLEFEVVGSDYDEKLDDSRPPEEVACDLAHGKALAVAKLYPQSIVIGADTIVTVDGKQLEKPKDIEEARDMLKSLSGRFNDVSTGVAVVRLSDGEKHVGAITSRVWFKPYDEEAVERYIATGDGMDKAGGYGIQSGAASLLEYIEGSYDNVIGLPTALLSEMLAKLGIKSRSVELDCPVPQRPK
jgi:septum formation protein